MSLFTKTMVTMLVTGSLIGLVGHEMGSQTAKYVCWTLLATPAVLAIAILAIVEAVNLYYRLRWLTRRQYRCAPGHCLGATGMAIVVLLAGAEASTIWANIIAGIIGFALVGLGWLINRLPPPRRIPARQ